MLAFDQSEFFALPSDLLRRQWRNVQSLILDDQCLPELIEQIVPPSNGNVAILVAPSDGVLMVVGAQRLLLELRCAQVQYEVAVGGWLEFAGDVLVAAGVVHVGLLGEVCLHRFHDVLRCWLLRCGLLYDLLLRPTHKESIDISKPFLTRMDSSCGPDCAVAYPSSHIARTAAAS